MLASPGFKILKMGETKLTFHLRKYDTDSLHMILTCKAKAVIRKFSKFQNKE